jgi:hypothetical protein
LKNEAQAATRSGNSSKIIFFCIRSITYDSDRIETQQVPSSCGIPAAKRPDVPMSKKPPAAPPSQATDR